MGSLRTLEDSGSSRTRVEGGSLRTLEDSGSSRTRLEGDPREPVSYFVQMERGGWIYIMTNRPNGVLYIGVTSDLVLRVHQHKTKSFPAAFTARYNLDKLVYYEGFDNIDAAMAREHQLKAGSRKKNIALVEAFNPEWKDLADAISHL